MPREKGKDMKKKTHVLIVNRNNLNYLKGCIEDLLKQTVPCEITVVDNASTDAGIKSFLKSVEVNAVFNQRNIPINHVWNSFTKNATHPYLCFLNNDVRIPSNFIADSEQLFEKEKKVGITCHATNNPQYNRTTPLKYQRLSEDVRQGWDYTIRRELFAEIPETLKWFFGDDYVWKKVYDAGYHSAVILSSPIIHFQGMTPRKGIERGDSGEFRKLKLVNRPMRAVPQSLLKPRIKEIVEAI
jgi:glycosyltransferase involved in cell wall biosynthesis